MLHLKNWWYSTRVATRRWLWDTLLWLIQFTYPLPGPLTWDARLTCTVPTVNICNLNIHDMIKTTWHLWVGIYQITFCQLHQLLTWTYIHIRPQFDKKTFPLEAQLSNLSPVESIDLGVTLQRTKLDLIIPEPNGKIETTKEACNKLIICSLKLKWWYFL